MQGFGPCGQTPVGAEIGTLCTVPEAWGTGTGRQLMPAPTASVEQAGCTHAPLWVLRDNQRARRFCEAAGRRADGTVVQDTTGGGSLGKLRCRRALS
ncbi:GNAT family N-acetyltransferase [Streptomyces echinatus]|uniref:GNAT family N-acetyltransferase n=1 Tax=Streptomyces echinatus TaxID=67293 RepID=UPI0037B26E16